MQICIGWKVTEFATIIYLRGQGYYDQSASASVSWRGLSFANVRLLLVGSMLMHAGELVSPLQLGLEDFGCNTYWAGIVNFKFHGFLNIRFVDTVSGEIYPHWSLVPGQGWNLTWWWLSTLESHMESSSEDYGDSIQNRPVEKLPETRSNLI